MSKNKFTIVRAIEDPNLFQQFFTGDSWNSWKTILKAAFNLGLSEEELTLYTELTQRKTTPQNLKELWITAGRRSGKSRIASLISVYLAFFNDWSEHLSPGEFGHVLLIAPDRRQARVCMNYVKSLINETPMLKQMVEKELAESIHLSNEIIIQVSTASFRTSRGYTCVSAVLDEVAFLRDESSLNPDVELLNSIRPSMSTVPNSVLVAISSPYRKSGVLWTAFKRHFAREDDSVLVIQSPSTKLNPTLDDRVISDAYESDRAVALSEYGGQFRQDLESLFSVEAVESCIVPGRYELPFDKHTRYVAACDPSGGGMDEFTLSICHLSESKVIIQDLIRGYRSKKPDAIVKEIAEILNKYRIKKVTGDRYSGAWVQESFKKQGIHYHTADKTASESYLEFLPLVNQGSVELLDDQRQTSQLLNLERRTRTSGKDLATHPPGQHDDRCNSLALAALEAKQAPRSLTFGRRDQHGRKRIEKKYRRPYPAPKILLS